MTRSAQTTRGRVLIAAALAIATTTLSGCDLEQLMDASPAERDEGTASVIAVVDGDTIDVVTGAGEERVRIIGIDTPEIGRHGEPSECYAEEARAFVDELLYGHDVELHADDTQADVDAYGRLLRHVFIDGRSAAEETLAAGAGYEYTYDAAYDGQSEHRAAESAAQAGSRGLWGAC